MEMATSISLEREIIIVIKSTGTMEMEPLVVIPYLDDEQVFKVPLWRRILMEMATLISLELQSILIAVKYTITMEMEPLMIMFYLDEGQIFEIPS